MLGNSFFITNSSNPDTPAETWTLIYSKTTPGDYSYNAGWGKYKIEISGGGGSGSSVAIRKTGTISNRKQNNGYAAQKNTVFVNTLYGITKVISGKVASGGKGSTTYASTSGQSITLGAVGTGYQNGFQGTSTSFWVANAMSGGSPIDIGRGAMAGGSGGGSTSLLVDGVLQSVAPGGFGGSASLYNSFTSTMYGQSAGTWIADGGKYGGPASNPGNHNGSAGGGASYAAGSDNANTSGNGVDGYVKIYVSNLKPEPL